MMLTDKQTHKHTLLKTIPASLRYAAWVGYVARNLSWEGTPYPWMATVIEFGAFYKKI